MTFQRIYKGRSMHGTFKLGDRLQVDPVKIEEIRPGEVVIYLRTGASGSSEEIVHRVLRVLPGGLEVQGDKNVEVDRVLVTRENLLGRVTFFERSGRRCRVVRKRFAGFRADCRFLAQNLVSLSVRFLRKKGKGLYVRLRQSGLVDLVWHPSFQKGWFTTSRGLALKYIHRHRTVATYWPHEGEFRRAKPYDLALRRGCGCTPMQDHPGGKKSP